MLLVAAVLLAAFVLPSPWGVVAVSAAAVVEVAETLFWIRLSRHGRPRAGPETLIGRNAEVVAPCLPEGQVRLGGELWRARCDAGAGVGEHVRVRARDGLTLLVEHERDGEAGSAPSVTGAARPSRSSFRPSRRGG